MGSVGWRALPLNMAKSLLTWCTKRGFDKMYQSASVCVFCCQFFAEGWRD